MAVFNLTVLTTCIIDRAKIQFHPERVPTPFDFPLKNSTQSILFVLNLNLYSIVDDSGRRAEKFKVYG
jgi:hypothetical protein